MSKEFMSKFLFCFVFVVFMVNLTDAQVKNVGKRNESDITNNKQKFESLDNFHSVSESPNSVKDAVYADPKQHPFDRTRDLIRRLTFEEKLAFTGGYNRFQIPPVERLGLRQVFTADASQGVRLGTLTINGQSTSFPGMLPLASTWNPEMAMNFGNAIGEECRALGVDILLGPGINMQRLSVGGRNFEYMGEDPLLTSEIASHYILGLENTSTIACPKHYIGNDQEFCRHIANSIISERALREVYLPPWKAAIEFGKASAIMTGNNLVNGIPAPMHKELNADILRKEYGFDGIAMTDWQNTNYYPSLQHLVLPSGETLLMPDNEAFKLWVDVEIKKTPSRLSEIEILLENMISPTIYTLFRKGVYDRKPQDKNYMNTFAGHKELARQCAEESIVLLKNEKRILPVSTNKKIVLYGKPEIHSGQGSGFVIGYDHVSFEQGLRDAYGNNFTRLEKMDEKIIRDADVIFFNFNKKSGEGKDIPYEIGIEEIVELKRVLRLNKQVVVLMNACNVMPMDWVKDVKGLLWCYFLGQERGHALANIVSGKVSPSGKLPFTIEKKFTDSPHPTFNYIGNKPFWLGNNEYKNYWLGKTNVFDTAFTNYIEPAEIIPVPYKEETLIGYRWYDYHQIPVHYSFGYGLSYAEFKLTNFVVNNNYDEKGTVSVEIDVLNAGKIKAKEVIQIYISDKESSVIRAPKELKAFKKVELAPGESTKLKFVLDKSAFAFWCEKTHNWIVESGEFVVSVGNSSACTALSKAILIHSKY